MTTIARAAAGPEHSSVIRIIIAITFFKEESNIRHVSPISVSITTPTATATATAACPTIGAAVGAAFGDSVSHLVRSLAAILREDDADLTAVQVSAVQAIHGVGGIALVVELYECKATRPFGVIVLQIILRK